MKVTAIIPARLDSKRFPKKVIYPFQGKPLIMHLYNELSKSKFIDNLLIATSDIEIIKTVQQYGASTFKTSSKHKTGSDRIAEVVSNVVGDIILNIQGDNFGLKASMIDSVVKKFRENKSIKFATLANKIESESELVDPNNVKVVIDNNSNAIYFSRSQIPFVQNSQKKNILKQCTFYHHIGIYLYRKNSLLKFASWKQTSLEKAESLEQLRILEHNEKIHVFKTKMKPVSIDTLEEMKKLEKKYR